MKTIIQKEQGGKLFIEEQPIPKPQQGEVLVKMSYAPINPSDLSQLNGTYANKPQYPFTPGIEGSGKVIESGGGVIANLRKGKEVACTSTKGKSGTWAKYIVTQATNVIPLPKNINNMQGAMLIVNPLTAIAFIQIAKKGKHKTIVNNAAASTLGKMLIKLCKNEHINLINIVRREKHVEELKSIGAKYILNSNDTDYQQKLAMLAGELEASLFFDAVTGEETNKIIHAAPKNSKVMLYANLSDEQFSIDSREILQKNITINGFFLGNWTSEQNILKTLASINKAKKLLKNELHTSVQQTFAIDQVNEAIEFYKNNMSKGKVLLNFE
jgi:NADPH:quinone reductase-like Zn-dependent oxidoreductase